MEIGSLSYLWIFGSGFFFLHVFLGRDWESTLDSSQWQSAILHVGNVQPRGVLMSRLQISLHMGLPAATPLRWRVLARAALLRLFPLVFPLFNALYMK